LPVFLHRIKHEKSNVKDASNLRCGSLWNSNCRCRRHNKTYAAVVSPRLVMWCIIGLTKRWHHMAALWILMITFHCFAPKRARRSNTMHCVPKQNPRHFRL